MRVRRATFKRDKLYRRVTAAVHEILLRGPVVAPVDLLIETRYLTRKRLEDWRFGRVPYLERVVTCNLSKAQRLVSILEYHAEDQGLRPSFTDYRRWGKGRKQRLRFSKFGNPHVERLYATHYVAGAGKKKGAEDARPPSPGDRAAQPCRDQSGPASPT